MLNLPQVWSLPGSKVLADPQGNALVSSRCLPRARPEAGQVNVAGAEGSLSCALVPLWATDVFLSQWRQHIPRPHIASFISQLHFSKLLTTSKCKTGTRQSVHSLCDHSALINSLNMST